MTSQLSRPQNSSKYLYLIICAPQKNVILVWNNVRVNKCTVYEMLYIYKYIYIYTHTTRIPEMLGRFLNFNKMKTKRLSNQMSQYFIHNAFIHGTWIR